MNLRYCSYKLQFGIFGSYKLNMGMQICFGQRMVEIKYSFSIIILVNHGWIDTLQI